MTVIVSELSGSLQSGGDVTQRTVTHDLRAA